jgi:hypothetical protein
MWCHHCRQDVPAIASGETARCAQCGRNLTRNTTESFSIGGTEELANLGIDLSASPADAVAISTVEIPMAADDGWLLDEQVRHLQRRMHVPQAPLASQSISDHADWSVDMASGDFWNTAAAAKPNSSPHRSAAPRAPEIAPKPRRPSIVAWSILSLGLMGFLCGGVLLVWAFVGHRNDLWSLGMPLALVGQFGLLLGLVLQLDNLWQANRRTAETLDVVDERLHEINHATTLLQSSHSSPAQSFYAHLAEGAHPHLLLADLKGQLDILATKMASQR